MEDHVLISTLSMRVLRKNGLGKDRLTWPEGRYQVLMHAQGIFAQVKTVHSRVLSSLIPRPLQPSKRKEGLSFTHHTFTDLLSTLYNLLKPSKQLLKGGSIATASPWCEDVLHSADPPFLFGGGSGYETRCCLIDSAACTHRRKYDWPQ